MKEFLKIIFSACFILVDFSGCHTLQEEELIEASACFFQMNPLKTEPASPFYRHKEGRYTCTGRSRKSSSSPRIAGVQWSSTVESTLWGMAPGVAVVLGIILGLAEIAPVSL